MGGKVLVVEDDPIGCKLLKQIFEGEGYEVVVASDGASALAAIANARPDVVALDLGLPDMSGFDVLERLREARSNVPVIVLTGHTELKHAIKATRLGAFDYLTKPIDFEEVLVVFARALETVALRTEVADLRRRIDGGVLASQMGPSVVVAEIVEQVRTVAASTFSVLVLGETGTGKELVADAIHRKSERCGRPLIAVDCGAIPEQLVESELFGHEKGAFSGADRKKEGQFQLAEGGTVFLDEIGNLPLALQTKLLRVLESRKVQSVGASHPEPMDVRFVAATNVDIERRVHDGEFRADLYFRLAQYTIKLPRLAERIEDIPYLAKRFLAEAAVELRRPIHGFAPDALAMLSTHTWPGNVRELRNVVRQAVLMTPGGAVEAASVRKFLGNAPAATPPVAVAGERSLKEIADEAARTAERHAIREALRACDGNKTQAARALKTDFKTLHLKMRSLGIDAHEG